jgi:hypothetical protein
MNKQIKPEQFELAAGMSREELLLARAPHIDPKSPALKEARAKVDKIALAEKADAVLREEVEFNWNDDDSIILREQRATAAYRNRVGELIIRQQAGWNDDQDTFIYISSENEVAFMEGLAKRAREG